MTRIANTTVKLCLLASFAFVAAIVVWNVPSIVRALG